jgi:hypothetical protein
MQRRPLLAGLSLGLVGGRFLKGRAGDREGATVDRRF